jgi:hypothetical protein
MELRAMCLQQGKESEEYRFKPEHSFGGMLALNSFFTANNHFFLIGTFIAALISQTVTFVNVLPMELGRIKGGTGNEKGY